MKRLLVIAVDSQTLLIVQVWTSFRTITRSSRLRPGNRKPSQ